MKRRVPQILGAGLLVAVSLLQVSLRCRAQEQTDAPYQNGANDAITDVPGVRVGNYSVTEGTHRGTTVIIPGEFGGICAMDVRGGNPITIGEATFAPVTIGEECDLIVLSGGSVWGLSTVGGAINYIWEHGHGVETMAGRVPVPAAAMIFDLPVGDGKIHPTPEWGYKAAADAKAGPIRQGNVGAGTGATVGKSPESIRLKGGLGSASAVLPEGIVVGVIVVSNSLGDFVNPVTHRPYYESGYDHVPYREHYYPKPKGAGTAAKGIENTNLVVIATNAELTKTQLTKVAQLAHDGLARVIRPMHTMLDGDTVIAVSPYENRVEVKNLAYPGEEVDRVGGAAADLVIRATVKGMEAADSIPGWTSYRDWKKAQAAH